MIETLRIDGLAVVDRVELEFGPGLNVLTGETGAGKSLVLGALSLLAGGRASAESIREGRDEAAVEAIFRTSGIPELEAELERRGYALEDHELVVRRALARSGRSKAQLAGQLIPANLLGELFAGAIEISSQHDSQALLRPEVHGRLLDRSGALLKRREAVADGFAGVRALDAELEALREQVRDRVRRQEFLSFQVREIDEAHLEVGELEALHAERSRLAHAERLRDDGAATLALLSGDPTRVEDTGAADLLASAARRLEELASLDPGLEVAARRIAAVEAELRDVVLDLTGQLDGIDLDPSRLATVEERLHRIEALQRKYGGSIEEVLRFRDEAAKELAAIQGADEREGALMREREAQEAELAKRARALSKGRRGAAKKLSATVEAALADLGMRGARFEVALEPAPAPEGMPCGAGGAEAPAFRFAANAGEPLKPLHKVASGGELSRAFLAIKGALREGEAGMLLVFDEVDAGIGGIAADRVGGRLAELAESHQVLCITHLPQIAAFADCHFRVRKGTRGGRTSVRIERIEGDARVEEIARMAAGEKVGEATRRHARELLRSRAQSSRPPDAPI